MFFVYSDCLYFCVGKEFFSDSYLVCAKNVNPFIDVSVSENKCDPLKKKKKMVPIIPGTFVIYLCIIVFVHM